MAGCKRSIVLFIFAAAVGLPASGSSSTGASTGAGNAALTSTPLVGRVNQFFGAPIAGPDGSYFTPAGNGVNRYNVAQVFPNGQTRILHEFTTLKDFNAVDGIGYNYDGYAANELVYASDGNLYGITGYGGKYGFGTFFRMAADGTFTTLSSFDYRPEMITDSGNSMAMDLVQGGDQSFYGVATINSALPQFFKLGTDGSYTSICNLPVAAGTSEWGLVAAADGSFYGLLGNSTVFHLTTDCQLTQIYTGGIELQNPVVGQDGNLYLVDTGGMYARGPDYYGRILKLTPDGVETDLHDFVSDVYWISRAGGVWELDSINTQGFAPLSLMQARDGKLYGVTYYQGLDGFGTAFSIATDGSQYQTLVSFPVATLDGDTVQTEVMVNAGPNAVALLGNPMTGIVSVTKLTLHTPLTTKIEFTAAQAAAGQPDELVWSSTGAQSCQLVSDIPKVSGTAPAAGRLSISLPVPGRRTPPIFTAGLQCVDADGNLSNATASVTVQ